MHETSRTLTSLPVEVGFLALGMSLTLPEAPLGISKMPSSVPMSDKLEMRSAVLPLHILMRVVGRTSSPLASALLRWLLLPGVSSRPYFSEIYLEYEKRRVRDALACHTCCVCSLFAPRPQSSVMRARLSIRDSPLSVGGPLWASEEDANGARVHGRADGAGSAERRVYTLLDGVARYTRPVTLGGDCLLQDRLFVLRCPTNPRAVRREVMRAVRRRDDGQHSRGHRDRVSKECVSSQSCLVTGALNCAKRVGPFRRAP